MAEVGVVLVEGGVGALSVEVEGGTVLFTNAWAHRYTIYTTIQLSLYSRPQNYYLEFAEFISLSTLINSLFTG